MFSSCKSIKVVLVGPSKVGKSCIIRSFVHKDFENNLPTTVSATFYSKTMNTPNGPVCLQIWDTAGQEKYRSLAPMYYRSASFAVLVFDVTNNNSIKNLEFWVKDIADNAPYNIKLILAGNKIDLADLRRISIDDIYQKYLESLNCIFYCETSAKTGEGVNELFQKIAEFYVPEDNIIEKRIQQQETNLEKNSKSCC